MAITTLPGAEINLKRWHAGRKTGLIVSLVRLCVPNAIAAGCGTKFKEMACRQKDRADRLFSAAAPPVAGVGQHGDAGMAKGRSAATQLKDSLSLSRMGQRVAIGMATGRSVATRLNGLTRTAAPAAARFESGCPRPPGLSHASPYRSSSPKPAARPASCRASCRRPQPPDLTTIRGD